jgi:hypothetical protein
MTDMNDKNSHGLGTVSVSVSSRLVSTRHDTPKPTPRRGEVSERARACGTPFSFYQLHKWSTIGPPFKLVKILIDFQCGIESLAFILWTF